MVELVPLKVKIGLRGNGHADHPNFNALPEAVRSINGVPQDWSHYVDRIGGGWHYDKCCGHRDTDAGNPEVPLNHEHRNTVIGVQYGCLLVDAPFAEAAVAMFPTCVIINEASFECFYDDRAHAHEPDVHQDTDELKAINDLIALEKDISLPTVVATQDDLDYRAKALDPTNQTVRGRRNNLNRRYATYKTKNGVTIRAKEAKVA